jgi:hypothetical protein
MMHGRLIGQEGPSIAKLSGAFKLKGKTIKAHTFS